MRLRATQIVEAMTKAVRYTSRAAEIVSSCSKDMARPEKAKPARTAEEVEIVLRAFV